MKKIVAAACAAAFVSIAVWSQGGVDSIIGPKKIQPATLGGPIPYEGVRPPVPTEGVTAEVSLRLSK